MSNKHRYAIAVGDAVHELSYLVESTMYVFLSVGEIAKKAEVSKPTAKKYLDTFVESGYMSHLRIGKYHYYRKLFNLENY